MTLYILFVNFIKITYICICMVKFEYAFTFANCMTLNLGWMGFMVILYILMFTVESVS